MQVLSLSLLQTGAMLVKMTFLMDYFDLVLLVLAQLLRFLIWSLTLKNFMESAASLVVDQKIKQVIKALNLANYIGLLLYITYGVLVVVT